MPDWPPVKTDREIYAIAHRILRCLEGVNLMQAHHILGEIAPHLLNSAHVVDSGQLTRLEVAQLSDSPSPSH
jgi:hypothetical protein